MSKRFYIEDFENSQSFVVLRRTATGSETAATIGYNYQTSKKAIKLLTQFCAWLLNIISKP